MRITRVILTNWGPHKSLDKDTDSPVVGLFGANGSGKTCFMDAIKFALTGATAQGKKAEDYIRTGTSSASVVIHIRHNGNEGVMTRNITPKTSKRKLVWAGKEYTSAKEVDAMLAEILSADKRALAEAVFPAQGTLHQLLFGTRTEQEELYIKIYNLSDVLLKANAIDGQIKQLEDSIVNVEEVYTHTTASLQAANEEYESIQVGPDVRDRIETTKSIIATDARCIAIAAQLDDIDSAIALLAGNEPASAYTDKIAELHRRVSEIDTRIGKIREYIAVLHNREDIQARIQEIGPRIGQLHEASQASNPEQFEEELRTLNDTITKANTDRVTYNAYSQLKQAADRAAADKTTKQTQLQEAIAGLQRATKEYEDIQKETEGCLSIPISSHELSISLIQRISQQHCCDATCPVCGSNQFDIAYLESKRQTLEAEVRAYHDAVSKVNRAKDTMTSHQSNVQLKAQALATAIQSAEECNKRIEGHNNITYYDFDNAIIVSNKRINDIKAITGRFLEILNQMAIAREQKATAEEALQKANEYIESYTGDTDMDELARLKEGAVRELDEYNTLHSAALSRDMKLVELKTTRANLKEERGTLLTISKESCIPPTERNESSLEALIEKQRIHDEDVTRRAEKKGAIEEMEKTLNNLADIRERNADTLKILSKLRILKMCFSRGGLPAEFVRRQWDTLLSLANVHLDSMGASYSIEPGDSSLSFKFIKNGYTLSQNMLSGGERVRAAIAFLLAFQQLVLRDVGFLVLDEPSMHVDTAGAESMRDMFLGISSGIWDSPDTQLIVCDHNEILKPAFDKLIQFNK